MTTSAKVVQLFHIAMSKWVNHEVVVFFRPKQTDSETGRIWKQSPNYISAVQIGYHDEYHCCLGGLLHIQSDERLLHAKLANLK